MAYQFNVAEKTPMTVEKAAEWSGYSRRYLYKLIHLGKIPCYKLDPSPKAKVILCKEELAELLFSNRKATNAELAEQAEKILVGGKA